ncbi:MAG TPA: ATP-dependent helicase [Thermoplasmataceae archaeon]|nr:ATP-dependent helicase [Thermoplasmataceae archaeon]
MKQGLISAFNVGDYLPFLHPLIQKWFNSKYADLTEPQKRAIPLIHNRQNVLVSSPTGTGKTLTGFLAVINELFSLARDGKLEDKIYCLYISPLKALANDINKNLNEPLTEISILAEKEGVPIPEIRAAVRSGDTPQNERQKMLRKPPHILITTPESFSLALSAPKFREKFRDLRYVIVDEIHEISSTKRGSLLSVNLERLSAVSSDFVRIGLSATQAPLDVIATYLCGYDGDKPRQFEIVDVDTKKFLDLRTITPVKDLTKASFEVANDRMYDLLADLINQHKTTLVFTNTRSGTEHVALRLKAKGIEGIEAHHSSMGKDTRIEVENKLKRGELKCVITSTSLELGIDIGYIDLVVQIGSPKSVSKGLQRIGRSGHGINELSKGRFLVFELDDLMECAVLTKAAYDREIDKVVIPRNSLDVLSQVLVGMALERVWNDREAFDLIRRSYCFHDLPWEDFQETLRYLSGKMESNAIYSKIWYDETDGNFGKKRSTRMIYFMNVGTIPEEADYNVISERGKHLGQLSDKFVERLKHGDIFVLGARTYMFLKSVNNRVYVKDATGMRPTVPSWTGEMLPRSYDLGVLIGRFRKEAVSRLEKGEDVKKWLMESYRLDDFGATSLLSYIETQRSFGIPSEDFLLVEGYDDPNGLYSIIFHIPLGRRVNDAISRAYAHVIANRYDVNTRITVTDDGFILSSQKKIPIKDAIRLLRPDTFQEEVRKSLINTEVFKQRFRHCAARSLMVLRKYKGYDISVVRQQLRSDKLLRVLEEMGNFPVIKETYHEIMTDMMDVPRAVQYCKEVIAAGKYRIRDYSKQTSPFSYGMILAGVSDMVLMEDRSKLLRELQGKILDKVYGAGEVRFLIQDQKAVEDYFKLKVPRISNRDTYLEFARHFPFFDAVRNRFNSPFPYADVGVSDLTESLVAEDLIVSVHIRGSYWCAREHYNDLRLLFKSPTPVPDQYVNYIQLINGLTIHEARKALNLDENELRNIIASLEGAYLIRRKLKDGVAVYVANDIPEEGVDAKDALRRVALGTISSFGPLTLDEISLKMPVKASELEDALSDLVKSGQVVLDYITPVFAKQYILKSDLDALLGGSKKLSLDHRIVTFSGHVSSVEEYFGKYGYMYSPDSLLARGLRDVEPELARLLSTGEIIRGRFIKHRLSYISRWLAEALMVLRRDALSAEEEQVLDLIRKGVSSESEIVAYSGLDRRVVRNAIRSLEFHILVSRIEDDLFEAVSWEDSEMTSAQAVSLLIDHFGPVSKKELMSTFWFYADQPLKELGRTPVYLKDDLYYGNLDGSTEDNRPIMVPVHDPLEIYLDRKYARDLVYNFIFIDNGMEIGSSNVSVVNSIVWMEDTVAEPGKFSMLMALAEEFRVSHNASSLVIECGQPETLKEAENAGLNVQGSYVTTGDDRVIEANLMDFFRFAVNRYIFHGHNIVFEDLKNIILGIRNDVEAAYLGLKGSGLRNYVESNLLFQFNGAYGAVAFGTMDAISIHRVIRNRPLSREDQIVVRTVMELGGATEQTLIQELKRDVTNVRSILKELFESCVLARDHEKRYIFVPEKFRRPEAFQILVEYLIRNFGFLSESRIAHMFGIPVDRDLQEAISRILRSGAGHAMISTELKDRIIVNSDFDRGKYINGSMRRLILPKDMLALYFADYVKKEAGQGNMFILVDNSEIAAAFSARKTLRVLKIGKIIGNKEYRDVIKRELNEFGYAVSFQ